MRNKFLLLLCLFTITLCFACQEDYYELEELQQEVIFDQVEDEYLIFFHKDTCSLCETILPEVMKYNTKVIDKNQDKPKVYAVNVGPENEKELFIFRTYKSEGGQGTDGKFFVDNVTRWGDLYIGTTPSIIIIKDVEGVKTAFYAAQGLEGIRKYLKEL